jgi:hypothetical protein
MGNTSSTHVGYACIQQPIYIATKKEKKKVNCDLTLILTSIYPAIYSTKLVLSLLSTGTDTISCFPPATNRPTWFLSSYHFVINPCTSEMDV